MWHLFQLAQPIRPADLGAEDLTLGKQTYRVTPTTWQDLTPLLDTVRGFNTPDQTQWPALDARTLEAVVELTNADKTQRDFWHFAFDGDLLQTHRWDAQTQQWRMQEELEPYVLHRAENASRRLFQHQQDYGRGQTPDWTPTLPTQTAYPELLANLPAMPVFQAPIWIESDSGAPAQITPE